MLEAHVPFIEGVCARESVLAQGAHQNLAIHNNFGVRSSR
jgi:hypothetical protein